MKSSPAESTSQPYLPYYELIASLGEGAVATVYRVRSTRDGATYALKSLKPDQATTEEAIQRFEDEFRILHRLHHPSLPEVFDYGITADGTRYIVLELIEGEPLGEYFSHNSADFWSLVYQLIESLSFIHEHDLLHLDLKPGNVLVKRTRAYGCNEMPLAVLIDFGLTYQRDAGGGARMIGTPDYMAPEIIRGESDPTRAADYYSLGVLLYEMVEGRVPFAGTMDEILRAHLTRKPKFGKTRVEYATVYPLIERLLSKEPNDRLEAFGELRRLVNERVAGQVDGLEKAYALGFIESLGLFGKQAIWDDIVAWGKGVVGRMKDVSSAPAPSIPLSPSTTAQDTVERVTEDLLSVARTELRNEREKVRYMVVAGPLESGKSFLLRELRAEMLVQGHSVFMLDDDREYEAFVEVEEKSEGPSDPRTIAVNRFRRGWSRLQERSQCSGIVLCVARYEALSSEVREFVEHVIKHTELALSDGDEPGIFLAIGTQNPNLKNEVRTLIGDGDALISLEIPPPAEKDIERILNEFHGHMSGVNERRALAEYLKQHLGSDGALILSLKHAVADAGLVFRGGQWEFHGAKAVTGDAAIRRDYYLELLNVVPPAGKDLLKWLACYRGPIPLNDLASVMETNAEQIHEAMMQLRPYRVVSIENSRRGPEIELANTPVADAIRSKLAPEEVKRKHKRFIRYLSGRSDIDAITNLVHHYEHAGQLREAFLERVKAAKLALSEGRLYALRQICEDGIVRARKAGYDHIERYFIKTLVAMEFSVGNYSGVMDVVEVNFTARGREVPLSFLYKYAYSVQSASNPTTSERLLEDALRRTRNVAAETYNHLLVVQVSFMQANGGFERGLSILNSIESRCLHPTVLSQFYVMSTLIHEGLRNDKERDKFAALSIKHASTNGDYEHLLRVHYHTALNRVSQCRFQEAKSTIRQGIRLATRFRIHRSLCTMYFLAGVVYHAEGNYQRAVKHIGRAIRIGTDIGLDQHVTAYRVRLGIAYKAMGRYGTALDRLHQAIRGLEFDHSEYLYGSLIMLEIYNLIHSPKAQDLSKKLKRILDKRPVNYSTGMFHWFYGDHLQNVGDTKQAVSEYTQAIDILDSCGEEDDAATVRMRRALARLDRGDTQPAREIVETPLTGIGLQSPDIAALYARLKLEFSAACNEVNIEEALKAAEESTELPASLANRMSLNASLARAYDVVGDRQSMSHHINAYYSKLKYACSDLPPDHVETFARNEEFKALVERQKKTNKKSPG